MHRPKPVTCPWCRQRINFKTGDCACPLAVYEPDPKRKKKPTKPPAGSG